MALQSLIEESLADVEVGFPQLRERDFQVEKALGRGSFKNAHRSDYGDTQLHGDSARSRLVNEQEVGSEFLSQSYGLSLTSMSRKGGVVW